MYLPNVQAQISTNEYLLAEAQVYPAALTVHPHNKTMYLGNIKNGSIQCIQSDTTLYFKKPGEDGLISTLDLKIFLPKQELWVCNVDFGFSRFSSKKTYHSAQIKIFDLVLGHLKHEIHLPTFLEKFYLHCDLEIDAQGNAFLTDTQSSFIYQIDAKTKEINLWLNDDRFKKGIRSIACPPGQDKLIVFNAHTQKLYQITISSQKILEIALDSSQIPQKLEGIRAMGAQQFIVLADGQLAGIQFDKLYQKAKIQTFDFAPSANPRAINYPMTLSADQHYIYYIDGQRHNPILSNSTIAQSNKQTKSLTIKQLSLKSLE